MSKLESESIDEPKTKGDQLYQRFRDQLDTLNWQPVGDETWSMMQFDGWPYELGDPEQDSYEVARLNLTDEEAAMLRRQDDSIVEALNYFDIRLKENHDDLIDYVDIEQGTVTIARHTG